MKRIVKRNNENANLKTLNHLITIDYVLALKSDNFAASKKTNSIVFVLVLNRKIITVKKKSRILCCFISILVVIVFSGCLFHHNLNL